jgi:broad specificity phosphatase PhoE
MFRRVMLVAALAAAVLVWPSASGAQGAGSAPTVVIIVRHAEKAPEPANDPELSDAGKARAAALAEMLRDANVSVVLHTATTRTRETARPTAERFAVTPEVFANARAMAEAVARNPGKTILVVGHSNTVMPYIAALGGPRRENLCDHQYEGLYTVVIAEGSVRLVEGRYGPPNPEPTVACGGMTPPSMRP